MPATKLVHQARLIVRVPAPCQRGAAVTPRVSVLRVLLVALAGLYSAGTYAADALRVTDYHVSHTSNEPSYAQQELESRVTLRMREVVTAGRERTVAQDGRVLLLIHGYSVPGQVAFDTDHQNCSLMRQLARAGWDTFAQDMEGFGSSTRPPIMDDPAALPKSKAPIRGDVTVRDVERAMAFINALRGTQRVHLLGWSQGATLEAPRFALEHPDKVAKLVLFGTRDDDPRSTEERSKSAAEGEAQKVRHSAQTMQRWAALGTKEEWLVPGRLVSVAQAYLASNPNSADLGGVARVPAGRHSDLDLSKPHFEAARITVPTLVIRGDAETYATRENNQRVVAALGSTVKDFVEITPRHSGAHNDSLPDHDHHYRFQHGQHPRLYCEGPTTRHGDLCRLAEQPCPVRTQHQGVLQRGESPHRMRAQRGHQEEWC